MGELIDLFAPRSRTRRASAADLARPGVERCYVDLADPAGHALADRLDPVRPDVRLRVASLPLVRGEADATLIGPVHRAVGYAVACGEGNRFLLACLRLAHAGGYDLGAPEVLLEATSAAGLELDRVLAAARDPRWAASVTGSSALLRRAGVTRLPALQAGGRFVEGEDAVLAYLTLTGPGMRRPRAFS